MKIYTKKGDKGTTGLFGGTRVKKSDIRIEAFGDIDELNSYIGLMASLDEFKSGIGILHKIQNNLFVIGSMLAAETEAARKRIPELRPMEAKALEREIDKMNLTLPGLKGFILPGGNSSASYCHIARCICRRAERRVVSLAGIFPVNPVVIIYLNRL